MTDAKNFILDTDYPIDKVSGFYVGSTTVAAFDSVAPVIPHGLAYAPLYFVKWSTDPDFQTSYDEMGVSFNFVQFTAQTNLTNLYLFILNLTASSVTVYYRVIYFMPTNVNLEVPPTQLFLDDFNLNTDYLYTKIFLEGITSSGTATVDHNLGHYPQVEAWYIRASDGRIVHVVANSVYDLSAPRIQVTTTQVIFTPGTGTPSAAGWHYKIYADEI